MELQSSIRAEKVEKSGEIDYLSFNNVTNKTFFTPAESVDLKHIQKTSVNIALCYTPAQIPEEMISKSANFLR